MRILTTQLLRMVQVVNSIREVFAYRLRDFRGTRTQDEFAEYLDMSKRTYQDLEGGNIPQRKTLEQLVARLGLPSETVLFLDPDLIPKAPTPSVAEALQIVARATGVSVDIEPPSNTPRSKLLHAVVSMDDGEAEDILTAIRLRNAAFSVKDPAIKSQQKKGQR